VVLTGVVQSGLVVDVKGDGPAGGAMRGEEGVSESAAEQAMVRLELINGIGEALFGRRGEWRRPAPARGGGTSSSGGEGEGRGRGEGKSAELWIVETPLMLFTIETLTKELREGEREGERGRGEVSGEEE
jgi:hypothetical protein